MDPLSAIGLASAVISFVQFSADVVSGGKEVYNSLSGQTEENIHIATVAAHLRGLSDELLTDIEGRTHHEKSLLHLARNCHALSLELLDVLESLAAKAGNPKWQSFKAGLRGVWKKDKVASLERALAAYKAELSLCLPLVLLDRQSFMREYLGQAVRDNAIWRSETSARMETQQQYLYQITKQLRNFQPQDEDRISGPLQDELGTVLDGIQSSLQNLQSMAAALPYETMILKRLYFSSIYNREDRVLKNTRSTFQWMTEGDHSQFEASDAFQETFEQWRETVFRKDKRERAEASKCFVDFLKYRQNGLFFICGKPGAGKSTMMKFLAAEENSRVRTMLRDWAGKEELVVVSVYFSRSTDELQMSLEGFYRSILFRMLKTCPALIWKVFPQTNTREQYWSPVDQPFRLPELAEAFKRLSEGSYNGIRFCLFIDGLDEYHAHPSDQLQLARSLLDWSRREDVKIVCGARPETSFIQVFQDSMTIYLHRLTASDIAEHAGAVIFKEIRAGSQTNVADLVKRIVQMAEGVFLWAYLVVRSLSRRINTYSERQLHSILDDTPAELTPLFSQMLDRIDPSEKAQSERILLALLEGTPYQNAMCVSWLEDLEDPTFPFTQNICAYPDDEIDRRLALVQQQVADLTGGLAEFIDSESRAVNARMGVKIHPFFRYEIGFFHRTARDFVANEWPQTQRRDTSIDFGTAETLARCHLALLRFSHSRKFHEKLMPHDGQLQPQKVWLDRAEPPEIVESFDLNLALRFIWLGDAFIRSASATSTPSQISSRCMDSIIATFEGYLDICPDLQVWLYKSPCFDGFAGPIRLEWAHRSWVVRISGGHGTLPLKPADTLRYLAVLHGQAACLQEMLNDSKGVEPGPCNYLLTSCLGPNIDLTKALLDRGWSPNDIINVVSADKYGVQQASVWLAFLRVALGTFKPRNPTPVGQNFGIHTEMRLSASQRVEHMVARMEILLRAGAEADIMVVLDITSPTSNPSLPNAQPEGAMSRLPWTAKEVMFYVLAGEEETSQHKNRIAEAMAKSACHEQPNRQLCYVELPRLLDVLLPRHIQLEKSLFNQQKSKGGWLSAWMGAKASSNLDTISSKYRYLHEIPERYEIYGVVSKTVELSGRFFFQTY